MKLAKINFLEWAKISFMALALLLIFTAGFKMYLGLPLIKDEYDAICPQNYGDVVSLERCYWPYKFEGESLVMFLKLEAAALILVPGIFFILAKKRSKN